MKDRAPTSFISYSWDSKQHKTWVRELATRLREDGVEVILDQWHTAPGDQLTRFMEKSVAANDFVLIVCTPNYKVKSEQRIGGVGYEGHIITAQIFSGAPERKFIPILREGTWEDAASGWLAGKIYIDLRGDPYNEDEYDRLLAALHGRKIEPPKVGESQHDSEADAIVPDDEPPKPLIPQPSSSAFLRIIDYLKRLTKSKVDLRRVIAALALLCAALVLFYGNNLCQQPSPPSWMEPILSRVCPPTASPTSPPLSDPIDPAQETATPTPIPISVGVILIPDYIYTEIVTKLESMGFDAKWIDHESDYSEYRDFDIIYLPAGWGYQSAIFHEQESSITSFLERGGGLFIERPNAKVQFTVNFLPDFVTFAPEVFDPLEYPSTIIFNHGIVDGLDPSDLPETGNLIKDFGDQYQVLTASAKSKYPTLLIAEPLEGRVVIVSSTLATTEDIRHPLSEELVQRALIWLAGRDLDT